MPPGLFIFLVLGLHQLRVVLSDELVFTKVLVCIPERFVIEGGASLKSDSDNDSAALDSLKLGVSRR